MNDKVSPKSIDEIQKNIATVCDLFIGKSDVDFTAWTLTMLHEASRGSADFAFLASIGEGVVAHVRAGGSVLLMEPPVQTKTEKP